MHNSSATAPVGPLIPGRRVEPEILDALPAIDPRAVRSRRDLRRINAWMGNAQILAGMLNQLHFAKSPASVVELGAGDGSLALRVTQLLRPAWTNVLFTLVDRQNVVGPETLAGFKAGGWQAEVMKMDLFEWVASAAPVDIAIANLFFHHFEAETLRELFIGLQRKTSVLVVCEPKRFPYPRLAGELVRMIGCSTVTCHDAIASIAAGFRGKELSALWSNDGTWAVQEGAAGFFSHAFCCRRLSLSKEN